MQAADRILIMALILVAVLAMLNDSEPAKSLPLVMADYQRCVTFHSELEHKPAHNYDYRVGDRHVDGGVV